MKLQFLPFTVLAFILAQGTAIAQEEILIEAPTDDVEIQGENPESFDGDFEFSDDEDIPTIEINVVGEILDQPIYAPFRDEQTVRDSTRPAYVINREQIEAQGYRTVNEALRYFPGVFVDSTAGNRLGALSSQIIRGGNRSNQTLILLDGRPINAFNNGSFDLSNLSTSNVERIELIPGGGSTLFGSNAIGGVLNIVTRRVAENTGFAGEVGADVGSFGYNRQEIAVSYGGQNSTVRLAYDRTAAENDFEFDTGTFAGTRENAETEIHNLNFSATSKVGDRHNLQFSGIYADKDIGVPGGLTFLTPNANQHDKNWLLSLDWRVRLGNADDSELSSKIFADFGTLNFTNPDFFSDSEFQDDSVGAQIQHSWNFAPNQSLVYGFDYRHNTAVSIDSGIIDYSEDFSQGALFANYTATVSPDLDLTLGIRQDFNSLADGSFTSPSAGLKWQAGKFTSLRANYARNFRAPTGLDLFFNDLDPSDFFINLANPDLQPETSRSFDIGIDQEIGTRGLFRLTYFNNTIDDALTYIGSSDPNTFIFTGQTQNVGKVRNQGLEAELTVGLTDTLKGFVNYTMNNSEILEDNNPAIVGNEVSFTGTDYFNVGLAYENQAGNYVGIFLKHVGDRIINNTNTASLDAYTNVDLRARYAINENVNLVASWENIFDQDYEVFNNFPGIGSRFQIGVNAKFR